MSTHFIVHVTPKTAAAITDLAIHLNQPPGEVVAIATRLLSASLNKPLPITEEKSTA